ncbi:MAG TPA: ribosome-associated translation inhibitor RaiA, partial [Clostridiales bacterium]|nr:ribosome-associated translation inhibitor RaiA [Clostridiales bacterium]
NLLGHQFYVFKNEEDDAICVVYRRNKNDYGLIEPID